MSLYFGRFWESRNKGIKKLLSKIVGESKLTNEENITFLVQIEGILSLRRSERSNAIEASPFLARQTFDLIGWSKYFKGSCWSIVSIAVFTTGISKFLEALVARLFKLPTEMQ